MLYIYLDSNFILFKCLNLNFIIILKYLTFFSDNFFLVIFFLIIFLHPGCIESWPVKQFSVQLNKMAITDVRNYSSDDEKSARTIRNNPSAMHCYVTKGTL